LDELLEITKNRGPRERSMALLKRGGLEYHRGKYSDSVGYFESSLDVARTADDRDMVHRACYNAASALLMLGRTQEAHERISEDLSVNQDSQKRAKSLYLLGNILAEQQKWEETERSFTDSLAAIASPWENSEEKKVLENRCHQMLAETYRRLGKIEESLVYCEKVCAMSVDVGDIYGEIFAMITAGLIYWDQKDSQTALKKFEEALQKAVVYKFPNETEIYRIQFYCALCKKDYGSMKSNLSQLQAATIIPSDFARMCKETARLAMEIGEVGEGQEYYEKALQKIGV
jgi:tetratricopeptide (TPR) repeat protein